MFLLEVLHFLVAEGAVNT